VKAGVLLLVLGLLAAAGIWAGLVLPSQEKSAADSAAVLRTPPDAPGPRDPGSLSPEEAARLASTLARLRGRTAPPAPEGIAEGPDGAFAGRIEWDRVQEFFAFAAGQERPVESLEVRALPDDPARAECHLVLGGAKAK
jgi:hypothetical protein